MTRGGGGIEESPWVTLKPRYASCDKNEDEGRRQKLTRDGNEARLDLLVWRGGEKVEQRGSQQLDTS